MSSPGAPQDGGSPQIPPQLVQLAVQLLMLEVQRGKMIAAAAQIMQGAQQGGAPQGGAPAQQQAPMPPRPAPGSPIGMRSPTQ